MKTNSPGSNQENQQNPTASGQRNADVDRTSPEYCPLFKYMNEAHHHLNH